MNATAHTVITFITDREADVFQALRESGALNIYSGKVTINFHNGVPQNVIAEELKWKRKSTEL